MVIVTMDEKGALKIQIKNHHNILFSNVCWWFIQMPLT